MRNRVLERFWPTELVEARAKAESRPLPNPPAPKPPGGHTGHFDYILDYQRCSRPATTTDIVRAFTTPALAAKGRVTR